MGLSQHILKVVLDEVYPNLFKVAIDDSISTFFRGFLRQDNGSEGEFTFQSRFNSLFLLKDMASTVVVKLLGRNIGYFTLHNWIFSLWKPFLPFQLMDIKNGYFLVKFQSMADYEKVLTQGSWIVFGQYLTVQSWTLNFDPLQPFPHVVMTWTRLPSYSRFLYKRKILEENGA
ncbi:hypothetical protein GOBAR_DD06901 [Gossypium barbadense]|nr:hypothetical protein GOBAR_DD06901 [Gossypium barbadense]